MQEEVKHYKVKKLPVKLRPNSVYYVKESSESSVKTYITDQNGFPFPLIDLASLSLTGIVNSVTGTGVTGTASNPVVNISTFKSSELGNLIQISTTDGKLFVKPITSPDGSIDIVETSSALEIQLGASIKSEIESALQPGDNISELNNDTGYITLDDLPTIVNDKNYIHNQVVASGSWEVQHNLDKYPSVSIVDSGNNLVVGEVKYIDLNNVLITFTSIFSGKAYLN
jgi:hypothetical protein